MMGGKHTPPDPSVIAAIEQQQVTRNDVLRGFLDAVDCAATSAELVAAWREIGKLIGAYNPPPVRVTHELLLPVELRHLSDAELFRMADMADVLGIEEGTHFIAEAMATPEAEEDDDGWA